MIKFYIKKNREKINSGLGVDVVGRIDSSRGDRRI